jgi:hypothetical protein
VVFALEVPAPTEPADGTREVVRCDVADVVAGTVDVGAEVEPEVEPWALAVTAGTTRSMVSTPAMPAPSSALAAASAAVTLRAAVTDRRFGGTGRSLLMAISFGHEPAPLAIEHPQRPVRSG